MSFHPNFEFQHRQIDFDVSFGISAWASFLSIISIPHEFFFVRVRQSSCRGGILHMRRA